MFNAKCVESRSNADFQQLVHQPGKRLASELRLPLESMFGVSFRDVRFIQNSAPMMLNARAFACGRTVVFVPGELNCDSPEGMWLLGHELAHIRQQQQRAESTGPLILDDPELEKDADYWGELLARTPGLRMSMPFVPCDSRGVPGDIVQCASAFTAVTGFITAPIRWAWNSLPAFRAGSSQAELNQQNIETTTASVIETTALRRQSAVDTPLFVPPQPTGTAQQQAAPIHNLTLAENMSRVTPLQLILRNSIAQRGLLQNDRPTPVPPTASALNQGIAGLRHVQTAPPNPTPDARGVLPGALGTDRLRHVDTRVVDYDRDSLPQIREIALEQEVQRKMLDMHTRGPAVKVLRENVQAILPDAILPTQLTAIKTAYGLVPKTGNAAIVAQLNITLTLLSEHEARVKEDLEITNLLTREQSSGFFDTYFSNEITSWPQLLTKLDERFDGKPGSSRVCPLSYATWEAILNEYNATPRDKSRLIMRMGELKKYLDREALMLKYGKPQTYYRGFTRKVSGGTGASWDCTITITEDAWTQIESGDGNADQIIGILRQDPILIQKDGTTKGNRAIKPEPYGWIFSTSSTLRLTAPHPDRKKIAWPPTALVFSAAERGH